MATIGNFSAGGRDGYFVTAKHDSHWRTYYLTSVGEIMYTRAPSGATDDSEGSFDDSETAIGANAKSRLSTANLISLFMLFIPVITLYE